MARKTSLTLAECTKDDLLWIIKRMSFLDGDYSLKSALRSLWQQKETQRISKAEEYSNLAAQKRREISELLSPYDGKPIKDIPQDVLEKVYALTEIAQEASDKFCKLM